MMRALKKEAETDLRIVHLRRTDAHALSFTVTVTAVRAVCSRICIRLRRVVVDVAVSRGAICRLCRRRLRLTRHGAGICGREAVVVGGPVCSSLHVQAQLSELREEGGQQARGRNAAVGLMIARGNKMALQQLRDRTADSGNRSG